jgi:hypothetical protein
MTTPGSYTLGSVVDLEESTTVEFKEVKGSDPVSAIKNTADNYAVGFLNSEGGTVYWGIRDDRTIVGLALTATLRDQVKRAVVNKLNEIQPHRDPSDFQIRFVPVKDPKGAAEERFVVELSVPRGASGTTYLTAGSHAYVRVNAVNQKLNGSQLNERISRKHSSKSGQDLPPDLKKHVLRVRQAFAKHGVLETQWARFLKMRKAPFSVSLRDLRSDDALLEWIDEKKLKWIEETFLLRREWLEGEDNCPHNRFHFDKDPAHFFETISHYADELVWEDIPASPEVYFIRWGIGNDWLTKGQSRVFVIVRVPLALLSREAYVYRYICDFEPYPWNYERTNIQLRAWARLLSVNKKMFCFGCVIDYETGHKILNGCDFLEEAVEKSMTLAWHPEDHALYPGESVCAKDLDTLPAVIYFLKSHGLPSEQTSLR